ncbi:VOC family protein [Rhizobium leguminosarum]|uniref:VOC family protein n=1 Tax=Rhizobium leguminosarum TaxID=384 RepID=UPI001952C2F7|nr:VOC family protein [Rhizobium leguminosarum]
MDIHKIDGDLAAVEMRVGNLSVCVAGSNPNREKSPSYGGPFFPKEPGTVSTIFQLQVSNVEDVMQRALAAGAMIRDEVQIDIIGRVASIFDPFANLGRATIRMAKTVGLSSPLMALSPELRRCFNAQAHPSSCCSNATSSGLMQRRYGFDSIRAVQS